MKIIWHFKANDYTDESKDLLNYAIKDFYEDSLIVFGDDLEITVIDNHERKETT